MTNYVCIVFAKPRNSSEMRFLISPTAAVSILCTKTHTFHRSLQFWEKEKICGIQVRWIQWWIAVLSLAKNSCTSVDVLSWYVIMLQNLWLIFPQFCAFLMNSFAQSAHNFKVVFIIDRTTLWQELMMHHVIANEENSKTFTFDRT